MAYALFYADQRLGAAAPSELEAWRRALRLGLITDIPVADEEGGQVLPSGFHIKQVPEDFARGLNGSFRLKSPRVKVP